MRIHPLAAALLLVASGPAAAQDWTGGYVGGYAGALMDADDSGDSVQFDRNLDGGFGDSVNMAAGSNALSPGF